VRFAQPGGDGTKQASGGRQPTGLHDEAGGLTPTARQSPAQFAQSFTDQRL